MSRPQYLLTLLCGLAAAAPVRAYEFNYDNLLAAWMKLNGDFAYSTNQVDSYMQLYRQAVYNQVRNNEFRLRRERKRTEEMMREKAKKFDPSGVFTLKTKLNLDKYDFDKKGFPITEMRQNDARYWYPRSPYARYLPSQFKVYFANTAKLHYLPMDSQTAEQLLTSRTNRYGRIDRTVYAEIRFRLKKIKSVRRHQLSAEIVSATLYGTNKRVRVLRKVELNTNVKK